MSGLANGEILRFGVELEQFDQHALESKKPRRKKDKAEAGNGEGDDGLYP
jgi:hypothetical protein